MLIAVDHLHANNIIHRDIKLENFLVRQNSQKHWYLDVKLADLGLGCIYDERCPPRSRCGTVTNMAPEMLKRQEYGPKVDVWALGIVLYELLSGELPAFAA